MNDSEYTDREEAEFHDKVEPFWGLPWSRELDESSLVGVFREGRRREELEEIIMDHLKYQR